MAHWSLGYALAGSGDLDAAADELAWLQQVAPHVPYTIQLSSLLDAQRGRHGEALQQLDAIDPAPLDQHATFHIAESFAGAGDHDRALDLLARAVETGFYPTRYLAQLCPFLEPLRARDRFQQLVRRATDLQEAFSAAIKGDTGARR